MEWMRKVIVSIVGLTRVGVKSATNSMFLGEVTTKTKITNSFMFLIWLTWNGNKSKQTTSQKQGKELLWPASNRNTLLCMVESMLNPWKYLINCGFFKYKHPNGFKLRALSITFFVCVQRLACVRLEMIYTFLEDKATLKLDNMFISMIFMCLRETGVLIISRLNLSDLLMGFNQKVGLFVLWFRFLRSIFWWSADKERKERNQISIKI